MGSPPDEDGRDSDEGAQHRMKVSPFWLGRYPVTNEQYGRFLKENPGIKVPGFWGDRKFNQAQQPVVGVSWHEARRFAEWAGGRLPTEAEWEYACRAGTMAARYENDLDAIAWHRENSGDATHPVGEKRPNAFGLHDMLGNVWEWCSDGMRDYPTDGAVMYDPIGPDSGSGRVLRGGSWLNFARAVRAANRAWNVPDYRYGDLGLRLARGLGASSKSGRSPAAAEWP